MGNNKLIVLMVLHYFINLTYSNEEFLGTWEEANSSCSLQTEQSISSLQQQNNDLPAWIKTNVLLSNWASLTECFQIENIDDNNDDEDGRQTLEKLFKNTTNIFGTNSINRCLLKCTDRSRYKFLIYFKNACSCLLNQKKHEVQKVSSRFKTCSKDNMNHNQLNVLLVFALTDSKLVPNILLRHELVSAQHCLISAVNHDKHSDRCGHDTIDQGHELCLIVKPSCYELQSSLPINNKIVGRTKYFRYMLVLADDDIENPDVPYTQSRRCLVHNSIDSDKPLIRIVNCSDNYTRLCTYLDRGYASTVSMYEKTETGTSNSSCETLTTLLEHDKNGVNDILIINVVLLICVAILTILTIARKIYKWKLVASSEHTSNTFSLIGQNERGVINEGIEMTTHYYEINDFN